MRRSQHRKRRHSLLAGCCSTTHVRPGSVPRGPAPCCREAASLPQGPVGSGEAEGAALPGPTQRQPRMVQLLPGSPIARLMAIEDGPGDVGGEVGQPHEAGEGGGTRIGEVVRTAAASSSSIRPSRAPSATLP